MSKTKEAKERRIGLSAVPIRTPTAERLQEHIDSLVPRPVKADVVTLAVERYLDEQEKGE